MKLGLLLAFLICVETAYVVCQPLDRASNATHATSVWNQLIENEHQNVYEVLAAFRADTSVKASSMSVEVRRARKWISKRMPFAREDGTVSNTHIRIQDVDSVIRIERTSETLLNEQRWTPVGPFGWDTAAVAATGSMGIGVIRTHITDASNRSLILAGTVSSGIWRSSNGGVTWTNVATEHPIQSVRRFAMNGSTVYAATDVGLYVSSDKGSSFRRIPLVGDGALSQATGVDQVVVSPVNSRRLIIAARGRLYMSTNGGESFSSVASYEGTWWDLLWHPTKNNVVYGLVQRGGHITFVRSSGGGVKFDSVGLGYPGVSPVRTMARACIATSRSTPSFVSVLIAGSVRDGASGTYGLYVSVDEGSTFEHRCCGSIDGPEPADKIENINLFDYDPAGNGLGQVTWDMAFAVNDVDTAFMIGAGIFPYRSTDGGRSWQSLPAMHYDVQSASVFGDTVLITNDGGLMLSTNRGASFVDRSFGISAMEIWGYHENRDGTVRTLGAYHLPIFLRDTTVYDPRGTIDGWYAWSGADAMGANVNPVASEWIYAKPWTSVRGLRTRTKRVAPRASELGIDLGYITLTNICFDPVNHMTIVACDHETNTVVRSVDNATTWSPLRSFRNWLSRVRMCPTDGQHLLALGDGELFRSTDAGKTWTTVTPMENLRKGLSMVDMCFSATDPKTMYVAMGGNQTDAKVLVSVDGGKNWSDKSEGLPSFSVRTIMARTSVDNDVYVGTSFGVYRSLNNGPWERLGTALPITDVNFLSFDEPNGMVRAATQRGVWQLSTDRPSRPIAQFSFDTDSVTCSRVPVRFGCRSTARHDVNFSRQWLFEGGEPATSNAPIVDVRYRTPGVYAVRLVVSDGMVTDTLTMNRAITVLRSECDSFDEVAGTAVDLTGEKDNVTLGRLVGTGSSFTFTAWVRPVGLQTSFSAILCTDADPGVEQEIGMQFVNDKNEIGYLWKGGRWWWNSGLTVPQDEWSHVALVVDTNGATVYVNGIGSSDVLPLPAQNLSTLIMKLGTYHDWSSRNFNGYIDEVAFYDRTLSQQEVRTQMHLTRNRGEEGLLAYYQFNELRSGRIYDKVGGRDGVLEAGARYAPSEALVGKGEAELVRLSESNDLAFPSVNTSIRLSEPCMGAEIVVTKLGVSPEVSVSRGSMLPYRWWIVDTFESSRACSLDSLVYSTINTFEPNQAVNRSFQLWSRFGWDVSAPWSEVSSPSSGGYASDTQTLRFGTSSPLRLPVQFAVGYQGAVMSAREDDSGDGSAFPNPASDWLTVHCGSGDVILYSTLGMEVARSTSNGDTATLSTGNLPSGWYVLRFDGRSVNVMILR